MAAKSLTCEIEVRVIEARNLLPQLNGTATPFCVVQVGEQKKKTKTIKQSLSPNFNEGFTIDISDAANFVIAIFDKASSGHGFMGEVTIPVNGLKLDASNNWFSLKENSNYKKCKVKGEVLLQFAIAEVKGKELSSSQMRDLKSKVKEASKKGDLSLELDGMGLVRTPKYALEKLTHYEKFDFSFNSIFEWPELTPFTNLKVLDLSGNKIQSISPTIGLLLNLRELNLNGNSLTVLPPEIGDLTALEKLEISNNRLKRVVEDIGALTKLETLSLSGNPIGSLPETIGECTSMEILDLSCCELAGLPDQFTYMTRLLELNLGSNKLEALPDDIGRMTRLVLLNLSDNRLRDLPLSLGLCNGLGNIGSGINIDRNPIKSADILKKWKIGTDHLLDYLEKRIAVSKTPVVLKNPPKTNISKSRITFLQKREATELRTKQKLLGATQPKPRPSSDIIEKKEERTITRQRSNTGGGTPINATPAPITKEDKLEALRAWATETIQTQLSKRLANAIAKTKSSTNANELIAIGQTATLMKPDMIKLQALLKGLGVTMVETKRVPAVLPTDKLDIAKLTVENSFREILGTVICIPHGLPKAQQLQVVTIVGIVKTLNNNLENYQ